VRSTGDNQKEIGGGGKKGAHPLREEKRPIEGGGGIKHCLNHQARKYSYPVKGRREKRDNPGRD